MSGVKTKKKSNGTNSWNTVIERRPRTINGQQLNPIIKRRPNFFG